MVIRTSAYSVTIAIQFRGEWSGCQATYVDYVLLELAAGTLFVAGHLRRILNEDAEE